MNDWRDYCTDLIRRWEGCKLHAYPDPATGGEPYTVGFGATGPDIGPDTVWTQEQADADLAHRLDQINSRITPAIRVRLSQKQRAALISLAYNIGAGALINSTLIQILNRGDYVAAEGQFARWNRAGGKVLAGLTNRRKAEAELFAEGTL